MIVISHVCIFLAPIIHHCGHLSRHTCQRQTPTIPFPSHIFEKIKGIDKTRQTVILTTNLPIVSVTREIKNRKTDKRIFSSAGSKPNQEKKEQKTTNRLIYFNFVERKIAFPPFRKALITPFIPRLFHMGSPKRQENSLPLSKGKKSLPARKAQ